MHNGSFPKALALGAMLVASAGVMAQTFTNQAELARLNRKLTANSQLDLKIAKTLASQRHLPEFLTLPDGRYGELVRFSYGRPVYAFTRNIGSANSMRVPEVWPGGVAGLNLTGAGVLLGVWEPGGTGDLSHPEFQGRAQVRDGSAGGQWHATHVTGTIIAAGLNPSAKGMSYGGRVDAFSANNDAGEAATAGAGGMVASNHSYGPLPGWTFGYLGDNKWVWFGDTEVSKVEDYGFGIYDTSARDWDNVLYNAPFYVACGAAGNERNPGVPQPVDHWVWDPATNQWISSQDVRDDQATWDTLSGGIVMSKNGIAVGAANKINGTYTSPASVRIASFSSWGPTDDGRIKPDVCAPGVNLLSTTPGGNYDFASGTSMATPSTVGVLGLMAQHYKTVNGGNARAATLKSILTHTAFESGTSDGPDYAHGWGFVNARGAIDKITEMLFNPQAVQELSLTNKGRIDLPIFASAGDPIKVTMAWTDPAGTPNGKVLDDRSPRLVNDLDIKIENVTTGEIFEPWTLDPDNPDQPAVPGDNVRDNVEQVSMVAPEAGLYNIVITHKGTSLVGGGQAVSVVVDGPVADGVESMELNPDTVVGGIQSTTAIYTLKDPAATDLNVQVASTNNSVVQYPTNLVIRQGDTSVSFEVKTLPVKPIIGQPSVPVTIVASSSEGSRSAKLEILPVTVAGITFSQSVVKGGETITGTVTLNAPAAGNGAAIVLRSGNSKVARSTRNWVVIPAGQTSATFTIKTKPVTKNTTVTFSGIRLGTTVTSDLTVTK